MIKKILVANRGEIARRIIKTASRLGIYTVSLYTTEEKNTPWVKEASESVLLGEGDVSNTYLNIVRIIDVAKNKSCDAIHPGYGFLSENYEFAMACEKENIKFIGPTAKVIKLMGDKTEARKYVSQIGIPIPQGLSGSVSDILANSHDLIYPVLIKAAAGGGGKGMHLVNSKEQLPNLLNKASLEATKWFGNSNIIVERYFENARHIEVQILGDFTGNFIHLFERECSLQRNYQKIIEEAPSPTLNNLQREKITTAAIEIAKAANYTNAGTIEFLWQNGEFFFLEMNTRIQVEHTVSEMITGIDIIEQQINIANNFEITLRQKDLNISGHAIQARIYAENPEIGFKPSVGNIVFYEEPHTNNIRIDSSYDSAFFVSPNYDGLISKVISHSVNRLMAIEQLKRHLPEFIISGIYTNISFLCVLLNNKQVINNEINTHFINENFEELVDSINKQKHDKNNFAIAAYLVYSLYQNLNSPANVFAPELVKQVTIYIDNKQYNTITLRKINYLQLLINGNLYKVNYKIINPNKIELEINNQYEFVSVSNSDKHKQVNIGGLVFKISSQNTLNEAIIINKKRNEYKNTISQFISPLHGTVSEILAKKGQQINQGDQLLIIESMKTENKLLSNGSGIVDEILIKPKDKVKENEVLIKFKLN